jgi:hypothetical protein
MHFHLDVHINVKTNFVEQKPYVLRTAMESQTRQRKKLSIMKSEKRNMAL